MTKLEALKALAEKVEAGEARPYEVEEDALDVWPNGEGGVRGWLVASSASKAYGGSIDAARAMHHPVSQYSIVTDPTCAKATYCFWPNGLSGGSVFSASAYSEDGACALLLAYIRALISEEESA